MTAWPWLSTPEATRTITRLVAEVRQLDRELEGAKYEPSTVNDIARWFGVPPRMLTNLDTERWRTETADERDRREWMDRR